MNSMDLPTYDEARGVTQVGKNSMELSKLGRSLKNYSALLGPAHRGMSYRVGCSIQGQG